MANTHHNAELPSSAGTGAERDSEAPTSGTVTRHAHADATRFTPRTRFLVSLSWALVISFVMLWGIPKLVPSSDAITHVNARLQSVLVGNFYPTTHRDDVTVLLIDDASLAETGQGWPVPYRTHARWLSVLGQVYKPRAVFVDITFTQARQDDTLPSLVQALCRLRDRGVPVFLAALPGKNGQLALRPGLESPPGEPPCFKLVGVDYEADRVDRLVWDYPLWREGGAREAQDTHRDGTHGGAPELPRSAALAMAEDTAGLRLAHAEEPMALVWGVNTTGLPRYAAWCRPYAGLAEVLPAGLRALWAGDEAHKPICPYSRALTMSQLKPSSEEDERRLHDRLDGSFVLVGTSMAGTNDLVASPVHGSIPGVFMHAMALDNLLTYGARYKRALEWEMPPPWRLALLGCIVVAVVHLLLDRRRLLAALGWKAWRPAWPARLKDRLRSAWQKRYREGPWRRNRTARAVLSGALRVSAFLLDRAWRIVYSTFAILLFIVAAQRLFDIGMLPVVDLATMALAAEWLGWTNKITHLALGADPDAPTLRKHSHSEE